MQIRAGSTPAFGTNQIDCFKVLFMTNYIRLITYIRPYIFYLLISVGMALLFATSNVFLMPLFRDISDIIAKGEFNQINKQMLFAVVLFTARILCENGQVLIMGYVGNKLELDIRTELFKRLQYLSIEFHSKMKLGDLLTRINSDVSAVRPSIIRNFEKVIPQGLTLIGVIGYLFSQDWQLASAALVGLPIIILLTLTIGEKLKVTAHKLQAKTGDFSHLAQESLMNIRVVKAFARESYENNRFLDENKLALVANMKIILYQSLTNIFIGLIQSLTVIGVIWFGVVRVSSGSMAATELSQFIIGLALMLDPLRVLSRVYNHVQQSLASAARIFDVLDYPIAIKELDQPMTLKTIRGSVSFDRVSFTYPNSNESVLNSISFNIKPGEVVAFVGMSGAGKSTLVSLIPRFYDPTNGTILLDGVPINHLLLSQLREQIGIVPQESTLFRGSIADNIRYGRLDASDDAIIQAAKQANAWEFIRQFPEQLDARVGDRGHKLSGGQKQRISIARAILKDPKILILDEATSALDSESEKLVQDALTKLMKNRTTFVIAHRLSTIQHADRIIVLDQGQVSEMGTHQDLLNKNGSYAKLYNIQFERSL